MESNLRPCRDLANVLMENGVGRPDDGGKRKPWCNESVARTEPHA